VIEQAGGMVIATDLAKGQGIVHALDVTSEASWRGVIAEVERDHGRLDGLVNAAGVVALGTVEELDFATWRRVLSINLDGTFLACKSAMPLLRKKGGAIVNLSSVSGLIGGHNLAAYNASKGGVSLLTKSVALYGARLKPSVRCNAICPAFIEGPMVDDIASTTKNPDRAMEKFATAIPLGRLGKREEVAALCAYLLSDDAAFITGADYPIDGGLTAQ
jgi:NAD(P)-dependent dehydrogenase (short-subunit alcohol dehydrogenase family)